MMRIVAILIASLGTAAAAGEPSSIWTVHTGVAPTGTPAANAFVCTHLYALSLDRETKLASWVGYRVTAASQSGRNSLSRNWQHRYTDWTLEAPDYLHSGYSIGHLCPLASVRADANAFEVNWTGAVAPQRQDMNAGPWLKFEELTRDLARTHDEVFVLCGPLYDLELAPLPEADEPHQVPSHYWARLFVPKTDELLCYIVPQDCGRRDALSDFAVASAEVCQRSGLSLCHDRPCEVCDEPTSGQPEPENPDRDTHCDNVGLWRQNRVGLVTDSQTAATGILSTGQRWRSHSWSNRHANGVGALRDPLLPHACIVHQSSGEVSSCLVIRTGPAVVRNRPRPRSYRRPSRVVDTSQGTRMKKNTFTLEVTGGDDIDKAFAELPFELRQRMLPKALRAGAKVIQIAARENLPLPGYPGDKDPGVSLRRQIIIKVKVYDEHVVAIVGPSYSAPHSYLVEYGHRLIKAIRNADGFGYTKVEIGFVKPVGYMRRAIDSTKSKVHDAILARVKKEITAYHKKSGLA